MDIIDLKSTINQCNMIKIYTISHNTRIQIQVPIDYKPGDTGTYPGI